MRKSKDLWESLIDSPVGFALTCIAVIGMIVAMVFPAVYKLNQWKCDDKTSAMDREHKYGFMSGCLVEDNNGEFVPLKNWRYEESD